MTTYGMLSTYPPTQCGLATFAAALSHALRTPHDRISVVAMVDDADASVPAGVDRLWVRGSANGARLAADQLNMADVVILQHEYGIFGGPDGVDVVDAMARVNVPVITVFHTVLEAPTPRQRFIIEDLAARSDAIVTMTSSARQRLVVKYRVDPSKIVVIPHGADATHITGTIPSRANDRPVVLTWGLLGEGKGIEWAIAALALLTDLDPQPVYKIVGKTHPKVVENEGERYRRGLETQVVRDGLGDLVEFDARYLTVPELQQIVAGADMVLLPYDSLDQVTSGVLVEAVTAGKPVISTKFPHAIELLSHGLGVLVDRGNPRQIADAIRRLVTDPALARDMSNAARQVAPTLLWSHVAEQYRDVAARLLTNTRVRISA
jgi:glycosyltransferase involved in cell wall biosynthesis